MQRERYAASLTDCIFQLIALWDLGMKRRKKTGPSVGERLQLSQRRAGRAKRS
jgi:hypothetical protein